MLESNSDIMRQQTHYTSAQDLIDSYFLAHQHYCLFLDIDGTISEFHVNSQQSFISKNIIENLQQLQTLGVMVMAVTGRSVAYAKQLFHPLTLPIAGTHGLEIQFSQHGPIEVPPSTFDFKQLSREVVNLCLPYPQLSIEHKTYAIALHFRKHPDYAEIAAKISQSLLQKYPKIRLNAGKCVYELILKDADKGQAILKLYQALNQPKLIPIFIGDDQTDESGFQQINQLDGISIKVGDGATAAQCRLRNVTTSAEFIECFKLFQLDKNARQSQVSKSNGEKACLN